MVELDIDNETADKLKEIADEQIYKKQSNDTETVDHPWVKTKPEPPTFLDYFETADNYVEKLFKEDSETYKSIKRRVNNNLVEIIGESLNSFLSELENLERSDNMYHNDHIKRKIKTIFKIKMAQKLNLTARETMKRFIMLHSEKL